MPIPHFLQRLFAGCLLAAVATVSGCAVAPDVPVVQASTARQTSGPDFISVVRYGRYTLAELAPTAQQRDLLLQVVDVTLPEDARATVGDGLRHVLKRSGYQLCAPTAATTDLYALPLPVAHLHLGPMTLRDALLTLVGPAWSLQVDQPMRQVCFVRAGDAPDSLHANVPAKPATDAAQTRGAQTVPLATGERP
jgi:type IV pili sensor histidine kinase/response regulator